MAINIINFEEKGQVITTLKYHGKNRFYLSSPLLDALMEPNGEMTKGDELVIKILAVNKFENNGDNKA